MEVRLSETRSSGPIRGAFVYSAYYVAHLSSHVGSQNAKIVIKAVDALCLALHCLEILPKPNLDHLLTNTIHSHPWVFYTLLRPSDHMQLAGQSE